MAQQQHVCFQIRWLETRVSLPPLWLACFFLCRGAGGACRRALARFLPRHHGFTLVCANCFACAYLCRCPCARNAHAGVCICAGTYACRCRGARKTAWGIPVRDLRLTERVLCQLSYRGTWCRDAAGAKQHMDRRARPRLGTKTIQASIGRCHHPAQLAPQRNDVPVRCRERGSDGKSSRTACLSFPKVCIRVPLAPAERAQIPQLSCANPKSGAERPYTAARTPELVAHARGRTRVNTMTRRFWASFWKQKGTDIC